MNKNRKKQGKYNSKHICEAKKIKAPAKIILGFKGIYLSQWNKNGMHGFFKCPNSQNINRDHNQDYFTE